MGSMEGYAFYLLVFSGFGLLLSILSFQYRKVPGRRYFWILSAIAVLIILTTALELLSNTFLVKLWFRNIQQIPFFLNALIIVAFVLDYIGKSKESVDKLLKLLSIPIIIYVLLIFTDQFHHLMRDDIGLRTVGSLSEIIVQPTILNRLFIIYNQILSITAIFILAISLKNTPKHYFKQHLLLLVGVMCPIILRLLRFLLPFEIVGFTALSFLPAYMIIYYALFRNQILSIWPVAKDKIFVNMKDGVILTDRSDLIVDLNPTAERILSNLSGDVGKIWIGQHLSPYIHGHDELLEAFINRAAITLEITPPGISEISYSATLIPIGNKNKNSKGMLLILSDISDKKRYERELFLQATMDELTGLYNRRHFLCKVREKLVEASSVAVSLILLDIDDFKRINDTHGHIAGDHILTQFSDRLKEAYTGLGITGRVGGEEFAVFLDGLHASDSLKDAERLRMLIEAQPLYLPREGLGLGANPS
ncbi:MAG: histidine kinase N-terminal 7TM domain-containing protein [Paenibacillaceae bacterium]